MTKPDITQAMINAYDEYTHLTLDRRGFMEKLTKLAGSGAAAATIAPLLAASPAAAEIVPADDPRLKGADVSWPGATEEMTGYLVHPADRDSTAAEADALAQGKPTLSFENRFIHKDGSLRVLEWTTTPDVDRPDVLVCHRMAPVRASCAMMKPSGAA